MENKLPEGWKTPLLGEIVTIKSGNSKLTKKKYIAEGKYVAFSGSGPDGKIDFYEHEGDAIILSAVGARCGKCFRANGKWTAIANTSIVRSKAENKDVYRYLFYMFNNENFWPRGGTGQPFVKTGVASKEIHIPYPPISEQKRIADKLDVLLAKVKDAQSRLDKIPLILKRFRQSIFAAACSGCLTADWRSDNLLSDDFPETWKIQNLSDLCVLITKGASPKWQGVNYTTAGILFVTSENVGFGRMLLDKKKYVEAKINEIQPRSILKKGDLLTNIVGASIGRTAIYDLIEPANINQAVSLIRLKEGVDRNYIIYVLNSPVMVDYMNSKKVDVARANLSLKDVGSFPIPVPPFAEQQEIVHRVKKLLALAGKIKTRYIRAQDHIDKLEQSILAKAFRGELVSQRDLIL